MQTIILSVDQYAFYAIDVEGNRTDFREFADFEQFLENHEQDYVARSSTIDFVHEHTNDTDALKMVRYLNMKYRYGCRNRRQIKFKNTCTGAYALSSP